VGNGAWWGRVEREERRKINGTGKGNRKVNVVRVNGGMGVVCLGSATNNPSKRNVNGNQINVNQTIRQPVGTNVE